MKIIDTLLIFLTIWWIIFIVNLAMMDLKNKGLLFRSKTSKLIKMDSITLISITAFLIAIVIIIFWDEINKKF